MYSNASSEKVWHAMTDSSQMNKWYFDIPDFNLRAGSEFSFNAGSDQKTYPDLCKITEVIPEKKLPNSWRYKDYPGNSLVIFELLSEGNETRIKLTHQGIETFPGERDFAKESFQKGWEQIICTNLKNHLNKKS